MGMFENILLQLSNLFLDYLFSVSGIVWIPFFFFFFIILFVILFSLPSLFRHVKNRLDSFFFFSISCFYLSTYELNIQPIRKNVVTSTKVIVSIFNYKLYFS